jgi:ABC-2 type transport system ATP-binding protein
MICDRVAIVVGGTVRDIGPLTKLLSPRLLTTEIVTRPKSGGEEVAHQVSPDVDIDSFVREVLDRGDKLVSVTPRRESLEDLFVREAQR